jgi:2-iminobutanoate/2-iminopropanoate deaminase
MRETVGDGLRFPGHFSAGAVGGGLLFVSGQPPTDLSTGEVVSEDFREQARQCLRNVETVVKLAGGTLDDVVKTTVWLHDWSDYATLNEVYAEVFPTRPPARSTVQGARPPGQRVAIEAVAALGAQ